MIIFAKNPEVILHLIKKVHNETLEIFKKRTPIMVMHLQLME